MKDSIRRKLAQVESYVGVPYAQKYHEPGTPDYDSSVSRLLRARAAVNDLQGTLDFDFWAEPKLPVFNSERGVPARGWS